MKKICILSWIKRDHIQITASPLHVVDSSPSFNCSYYQMNHYLIELHDFSELEYPPCHLKSSLRGNKILILVNQWNDQIEYFMKTYLPEKAVIVTTQSSDVIPLPFKQGIELLEEKLDLDGVVGLLTGEFQSVLKPRQGLLMGTSSNDNLMYQIVVTTLQQLSRLSKYKQLQIYLVSSHAIDLKVLALIEDALLEYLDYEQLTIHTSLSSDEMADIHYVLLFND